MSANSGEDHYWLHETHDKRIENNIEYIKIVAKYKLGTYALDTLPVSKNQNGNGKYDVLITPQKFEKILTDCDNRSKTKGEFESYLKANYDLALHEAGYEKFDSTNPHVMLAYVELENAPNFIKNADIPLDQKLFIHEAYEDISDDQLLKAKEQTCKLLEQKQSVMRGSIMEKADIDKDTIKHIQQHWHAITPELAFDEAVQEVIKKEQLELRDEIFSDRSKLVEKTIKSMMNKYSLFRETKINEILASEIMRERLEQLSWPELILLSGFCLGDEYHAKDSMPSLWLKAIENNSTEKVSK